MHKIIWVARYLRKISLITLLFATTPLFAVDSHRLFVPLSDAMSAAQVGDEEQIQVHLEKIKLYLNTLPENNSQAGQAVQTALQAAQKHPQSAQLQALAKALYAFEKEQNPIDYTQKRQKFAQRIMPVYQQLQAAIAQKDLEALQQQYKKFNSAWTINEKVVRDTSLGHYGQIETAMNFLRIAMLSDNSDFALMQTQSDILGAALEDFIAGNVKDIQSLAGAPETLAAGIELLEKAQAAMLSGDYASAQADLHLFLQQWPIFEGEVRTRDGALYTRLESELPLILAKIQNPEQQEKFSKLFIALKAIDPNAAYGMLDAMLILLREGVEALLIIFAMLAALNASQEKTGQKSGKAWIYAGALLGLVASLAAAFILQTFFPSLSASSNREILEGVVGIVAVLVMLFVGAWLHSKSSLSAWQRFIDKHLKQALATGSLLSLALLSFLAVFREGAETLLFYAAMLGRISITNLITGIALALLALAAIALIMQLSSRKIPIHRLFALMSALIYLLGFKILGISIHALQLTQLLPTHIVSHLPALPLVGFYPTWEGIMAQALYLFLIPISQKYFATR